MKILCAYCPCGPSFVRTGWGRVFHAIGHQFVFWQPEVKPAFDIFSEYEPDLFIGTTFDLDRATYKCIKARPNMKVILYASAWGKLIDDIPANSYPIVRINDKEKTLLEKLKQETGQPEFVFLHYHDNWIEPTLGGWRSIGITPVSMLNAADTFDYFPGQKRKEFSSAISFVGGYWGYKSRNLDRFLMPLCHNNVEDVKVRIKIYGNQPWPVPQYLGYVNNEDVRDIFASSLICPNVSEPHSTDFGFDVVERPFKVLSSGAFCISDYVESSAKDIFGDCVPHAKTPNEFFELLKHYMLNPDERIPLIEKGRKLVLEKHTYFDRIYALFLHLNMPEEANKVGKAKIEALGF